MCKLKYVIILPEGVGYRARLLCELDGDDFLLTVYESTAHNALDSALAKYYELEGCVNA